jgi:hypothetical protein
MPSLRAALVLAAVTSLSVANPSPVRAAEAKRFGIEGMLIDYDEAKSTFKIKVTSPKVSGGFGAGGIAGDAPSGIKAGDELEFAVVPEGSVLKRTVIKASKGGGLDNSGTKEGFKKAVGLIPKDRAVVLSFEEPSAGPKYLLKMVQIRLSPEEIAARLREMGLDPNEVKQDEAESAN